MTNEEAIRYLIQPFATSTKSYNEYLKQKEAYELAIKALTISPEKALMDKLNNVNYLHQDSITKSDTHL